MGFKYKRPLFLGVLLIIFTLIFWTQSRYPQLNEKEQMSGRLKINEALSFDVVYPIHDKDPLFKKTEYVINLLGLNNGGYKIISNSGLNGGQEVPHFHIHILGGEKLNFKL